MSQALIRNAMLCRHLQTSLHIIYTRHNGYCATNGVAVMEMCLGMRLPHGQATGVYRSPPRRDVAFHPTHGEMAIPNMITTYHIPGYTHQLTHIAANDVRFYKK